MNDLRAMNDLSALVTRRLIATRSALGLSVRDVAKASTISPNYLGEMEKLGVGNIGIATLAKWCKPLGVMAWDVVNEDATLPDDMTQWRFCPHCREAVVQLDTQRAVSV